jgi:hypothetical protein
VFFPAFFARLQRTEEYMGRFRLGAVAAFTLVMLAAPAGRATAAEITRVASRGEPGNPFELHVSLRWDRDQERATIERERPTGDLADPVEYADELRYVRTRNAIVPRVAVAIAQDFEIHLEWPYVLADDREWRFGQVGGAPSGGVFPFSTIERNEIDAEGQPCNDADGDGAADAPCPLFPVHPTTTVYHGGKAGDLKAGFSWGVFNDRRDPTKPYWLLGLDVTFPSAALYDPAADRGTDWSSPHNVPGKPGAFGEKIWKWDLYTVLSRRLGPIDPYVKAHATLMSKSSSTYSNCDHAAELSTVTLENPVRQMTRAGAANCAAWADDADARLPWVAGLTVGTELVPYEDDAAQQRVAMDVRLFADYTSSQRFYNELTDATGRLHETEDYLTLGGFFGLYLRASRYVSLHATASLATQSAHFLSGESLGRDGSWPTPDPLTGEYAAGAVNPNYDWRYDAPGRRFRISEVALFQLSFGGTLQF